MKVSVYTESDELVFDMVHQIDTASHPKLLQILYSNDNGVNWMWAKFPWTSVYFWTETKENEARLTA